MRLVTWNVLWRFAPDWRARERAILTTLENLQPDVIGLQECWATEDDTQADRVGARLGLHAVFAARRCRRSPIRPSSPTRPGCAWVWDSRRAGRWRG